MSHYVLDLSKRSFLFGISDPEWDVRVGFDDGHGGYWMTVDRYYKGSQDLEGFEFHNLRDCQRPWMTLEEVLTKLSEFGIALPHTLACQLIQDGINGEHVERLQLLNMFDEAEAFERLSRAILSSRVRCWPDGGKVARAWRPLEGSN